MLKSNQYKIAAMREIANSQRDNASATRGLAREQSETNKLLSKQLEVKDRVDISLKEYNELCARSEQLDKLIEAIKTLLSKTGLRVEELCELKEDDILVNYTDNPMDFKLYIDTRMKVNLSPMRVRELLRYNR